MQTRIEREFVAAGANTGSDCVKWLELSASRQVVAFAVSNTLAIAELRDACSEATVVCTLRGHQGRINAIACCHSRNELVSCSEDGSVRVWGRESDGGAWAEVAVLLGLKSSGVAVSCLSVGAGGSFVAASDTQGSVCIWLRPSQGGEFVRFQDFTLPPAQTPHALHLVTLPKDSSVQGAATLSLLVGSVDARVHVYVNDPLSRRFESVGSLPGHEEWVTSLASTIVAQGSVYVASGSKDCKIRVWKFVSTPRAQHASPEVESPQANGDIAEEDEDEDEDELLDAPEGAVQIAPEEIMTEARLSFRSPDGILQFNVFLETLLVGHEDWVSSVEWMRTSGPDLADELRLILFSTSMDRNMVMWSPGQADAGGVWSATARIGDVGGQLGGSVGGNLLGFVGGCSSPEGSAILGVGYGGSFHLWRRHQEQGQGHLASWSGHAFLSGHFGSVNDVAWSTCGRFLFAASSDQTVRLFAPVPRGVGTGAGSGVWREVSRPQIHGYNMTCVVPLSPTRIITAGEEKLLRVFDMPLCVRRGLRKLCDVDVDDDSSKASTEVVDRAYIPELGLSNRAVELMSKAEAAEQEARGVEALDWSAPPLEGQLADHTIWPESKKLFGHSNDVLCVALSSTASGNWLASASKARDAATAAIVLWDPDKMAAVSKLQVHESSVVCLQFSGDGRYLASAGKDRSLCIFMRTGQATQPFEVHAEQPAAHKRIIWDCSWAAATGPETSGGDEQFLVTGSRDGACKVWRVRGRGDDRLVCMHSFVPFGGAAVMALHCRPLCGSTTLTTLAVGCEDGNISVWQIRVSSDGVSVSAEAVAAASNHIAHGASVKRLRWSPTDDSLLASGSADCTMRVYRIDQKN